MIKLVFLIVLCSVLCDYVQSRHCDEHAEKNCDMLCEQHGYPQVTVENACAQVMKCKECECCYKEEPKDKSNVQCAEVCEIKGLYFIQNLNCEVSVVQVEICRSCSNETRKSLPLNDAIDSDDLQPNEANKNISELNNDVDHKYEGNLNNYDSVNNSDDEADNDEYDDEYDDIDDDEYDDKDDVDEESDYDDEDISEDMNNDKDSGENKTWWKFFFESK